MIGGDPSPEEGSAIPAWSGIADLPEREKEQQWTARVILKAIIALEYVIECRRATTA